MNHFGPRLLLNLALGSLLASLCWLFDPIPGRVSPILTPAASRGVLFSGIMVWSVAAAFLGSLFFPTARHWLAWRYTSPLFLIFIGWRILDVAGEHGRDFALVLTHGTLIPALLLAGPAAGMILQHGIGRSSWFRELFAYGRGHSAIWSTRPDYHRVEVALPRRGGDGKYGWLLSIYLGMSRFRDDFVPRHIAVKTDVHVCQIGMSGSSKGACGALNVLGTFGGACFCIEPKGDYAMIAGRRRAELGNVYNCDAFQVSGQKQAFYNPFAGVDPETREGRERLRIIAEAIVLQEATLGAGEHFSQNAQTIWLGASTHLCSAYPPAMQTPPVLYDILMSRDPKTGGYDPDVLATFLADMSQNPAGGGICIQAAKLYDDAGKDEAGSFSTTLSKSIRWIGDPAMRAHLSHSDFAMTELATLGPRRPTVFVNLGIGREIEFKPYLRMMAALAIHALRSEYRRTGHKPSPGCLLMIDEYPLIAKNLECISTGFGNLREVGACLYVQAQKASQISDAIGDKAASLLLQNSAVQILAVNNDAADVAKWVSDHLGSCVVSDNAGRLQIVPLMTPRDVMDALKQRSENQIVFPVGLPPMWLRRMAYTSFRIDGEQCFKPLPFEGMFDPPRG